MNAQEIELRRRLVLRRPRVVSPAAPPARRTSARRSAVLALAVGLAVAAAAQLAVGWAIRTDRLPMRDPVYADRMEVLRAHPGFAPAAGERPRRLLFVGSSRTLNGINAGAAEAELARRLGRPVAAFNFGSPGAGPVTNALYLRRLLADGVRPDAVVIEVHPLLLAAQVPDPPEACWFSPARLRPEELPLVRGFGFPAAEPGTHGPRGRLLPIYEYRIALVDRYATPLSTLPFPMGVKRVSDRHGYVRTIEAPEQFRPRMRERARQQYAAMLEGYRPGGCGAAALRDSLAVCRDAGVRPALLLAPESNAFRGWYPAPGLAELAGLLGGLSREFGCPVFDARRWLPDDLFIDGHHPTPAGADACTGRLAREALAPWLSAAGGESP